MSASLALALVAFVPAMVGGLPEAATTRIITASMCGGGVAQVRVPGKLPQRPAPCLQKVCHAPCHRKRFDASQ